MNVSRHYRCEETKKNLHLSFAYVAIEIMIETYVRYTSYLRWKCVRAFWKRVKKMFRIHRLLDCKPTQSHQQLPNKDKFPLVILCRVPFSKVARDPLEGWVAAAYNRWKNTFLYGFYLSLKKRNCIAFEDLPLHEDVPSTEQRNTNTIFRKRFC